MRTRSRVAGALIAAAIVTGLAGCSSNSVSTDGAVAGVRLGGEAGFVGGDGTVTIFPVDNRLPAPDLAGTTLEEKSLALSDFRGKTVVLNVWASWCVPCREEAPALEAVAESYADRGVRLVGINTRDSNPPAKSFQERFSISYPSLVDPDGQLQLLFRDSISPQAVPSTLIIDEQGRIAARVIGPVTRLGLSGLLDEVMGTSTNSGAPSPNPTSS